MTFTAHKLMFNASQVIANSAPTFISPPVASGDVYQGSILSCTTGLVGGYPSPTYTYQWRQNGTNISGATSSTITLNATQANNALAGQTIDCVVTATNGSGSANLDSNNLSAFAPTAVGAVAAWYDANDAASITSSGGLVSQWSDKSGNARHATQGNGAAQPTTGSVTINSRNTLDFNTAINSLNIPVSVLGANQPALTIFGVYLPDSTNTTHIIIASDGYNENFNSTKLFNQAQNFGDLTLVKTSLTSGSPLLHVARTPGNGLGQTSRLKINADAQQTSGTYIRASSDCTTGAIGSAAYGGSGNFDGKIAEIIVFQTELSDADVNRVAKYLSGKWGVTYSNVP